VRPPVAQQGTLAPEGAIQRRKRLDMAGTVDRDDQLEAIPGRSRPRFA